MSVNETARMSPSERVDAILGLIDKQLADVEASKKDRNTNQTNEKEQNNEPT